MKKLLINAAVTAALVSAGAAHAAATQVNFGFTPKGSGISYDGSSLDVSTSINFNNVTFETNTLGLVPPFADDSGAFLDMVVNLSQTVFDYIIGETSPTNLIKTFTTGNGGAAGSAGDYTATFTSFIAEAGGDDFVNLTFQGAIVGPGGFSAVDVQLLNCNQSGGAGSAVNCSFTEQGPPVPTQVPEPATLALVGLSLAGLIAARRRRPS